MASQVKQKGWYLDLMAPNVKGSNYCWLDPSAVYRDAQGFADCVQDLVNQLDGEYDIVAGIDAMGFILGGAIASRLKKGFLALRKSGHLCVETVTTSYTDYSKTQKVMEVGKDPFPPGSRVVIVDQWIETGGTARGAVDLVEACGGKVAAIAAICIENSVGAKRLREKYRCVDCTPNAQCQQQIDNHFLDCWK